VSAPTSSRWLDAEWIAEVLALRASGEVQTARSAMPRFAARVAAAAFTRPRALTPRADFRLEEP
jgi:hypothetical protein